MKIVYIDGVFDLFHRGHLESLIKAKNIFNDTNNTLLIVGIVNDKDCESYKRKPIIKEDDRVEIIKNLKIVDDIIFPCPLIVTNEFLEKNNIDLVVHGFVDENDRQKQKEFFNEIVELGKFKEIDYYKETSTTKIIKKIKDNY